MKTLIKIALVSLFFSCQPEKSEVKILTPEKKENILNHLYLAINSGEDEIVLSILNDSEGTDVNFNEKSSSGITPLTQYMILRESEDENSLRVLQKLIALGADPNIKTNLGLSPLHIAIQNNQIESFKTLVKNGADTREFLDNGESLLELAKRLKRNKILKFFELL